MSDQKFKLDTYYALLDVPENASGEKIRLAYIKRAKEVHPDSAKSPEEVERLNEEFILINRAYKILRNDAQRQEYDSYLKKKRLERKMMATRMGATSQKTEPSPKAPASEAPQPPRQSSRPQPKDQQSGQPTQASPDQRKSALNLRQQKPQRKSSKESAEQQFNQVMDLLSAGNLQKAREKLRLILKIDPNNPKYCTYLVYVNVQLKTGLNEAHQFARKAIQLEPDNPQHHYHLGLVFELAGHEQKAKQKFNQALEINPRYQDALTALQKYQHKESFWKKNIKGLFNRDS